jgi:hypothetical protein
MATIAECFESQSPRILLFTLNFVHSFMSRFACFQVDAELLRAIMRSLPSKVKSLDLRQLLAFEKVDAVLPF